MIFLWKRSKKLLFLKNQSNGDEVFLGNKKLNKPERCIDSA